MMRVHPDPKIKKGFYFWGNQSSFNTHNTVLAMYRFYTFFIYRKFKKFKPGWQINQSSTVAEYFCRKKFENILKWSMVRTNTAVI